MTSAVRRTFRDSSLFHWYKRISAPIEYAVWRLKGSPGPTVPHLQKQRTLQQYARDFGLSVLVETGTNFSHMLYVQQNNFREIFSVELDEWKAESARRKFGNDPRIHLYTGDSGKVLPSILAKINEPTLFWLDGHDGDISAAIKPELEALYKHPIKDHVLLIDDARWFDGRTDYPTIEEMRAQISRDYPGHIMEVKDDIIRIHKPQRS